MDTNSIQNNKSQLAVIFLTVFIYLVGFGIVIPMTPILSRDFGATAFQTGLLMSIYSLMQFVFAPFWGKLSDRYGRRPILVSCLFFESLTYILLAMARNLEMLFLARALAGFFGASLSTASAYISDITPPHERSKGMALIGAAFGLGFFIGPALGGFLTTWGQSISSEPFYNTSFTSYWVAGICFATFVFAFFKLKESLKVKQVSQKKERLHTLLESLKKPVLGQLVMIFGLVSFAMSAMEATFILYMGEAFQWSVREVSFGFAYIGVIIIFTQGFLVRRLLPLWGERKVLKWGLVSFTLGLFLIALAPNLILMTIAVTLLSLGNGLSNPSLLGSISLVAAHDEQGASLGVTQSLSALGRIIGPAVGGFLFQKIHIIAPFITSGLIAALAFLLVLRSYRLIPEKAKTS